MLGKMRYLRRKKKPRVFRSEADKDSYEGWTRMMSEIERSGSSLLALRLELLGNGVISRDLIIGTLKRFKQLKKWNLVIEILEWLQRQRWWNFSERDFLMLMTAHGKEGAFEKAEAVQRDMKKEGYMPNLISCTALVEAYGRAGEYDKCEAAFRQMPALGFAPSALTYQIILKAYVSGEKYEKAEELFESALLGGSDVKPDQQMFHMMIYMYMKAGNTVKARHTFELMVRQGIERSTVTYNSLMSFHTDHNEVEKIFYEMQRAGFEPDVVSYALLVQAFGKARKEDHALLIFEDMVDAGVRYVRDICSYTTMLAAYANASDMDGAERFFTLLQRDGLLPNATTHGTLIRGYADAGSLDGMMRAYHRMVDSGLSPTHTIHSTIITAYVNASDMDGAERFYSRLRAAFLLPHNAFIYAEMMRGYADANNQEKMIAVYDDMRSSGLKASRAVYHLIVSNFGMRGDFDGASIWFERMRASGVAPSRRIKNALLSFARTANEVNQAEQLVRGVRNVHDDDHDHTVHATDPVLHEESSK